MLKNPLQGGFRASVPGWPTPTGLRAGALVGADVGLAGGLVLGDVAELEGLDPPRRLGARPVVDLAGGQPGHAAVPVGGGELGVDGAGHEGVGAGAGARLDDPALEGLGRRAGGGPAVVDAEGVAGGPLEAPALVAHVPPQGPEPAVGDVGPAAVD